MSAEKDIFYVVSAGNSDEQYRMYSGTSYDDASRMFEYYWADWGATWVRLVRRSVHEGTTVERPIKSAHKDSKGMLDAVKARQKMRKKTANLPDGKK